MTVAVISADEVENKREAQRERREEDAIKPLEVMLKEHPGDLGSAAVAGTKTHVVPKRQSTHYGPCPAGRGGDGGGGGDGCGD